MNGYQHLRSPESAYRKQKTGALGKPKSVPTDYKKTVDKYTTLLKGLIKEIYAQKIPAFQKFYDFCMFDLDQDSKARIDIDKSDFLLIQSFLLAKLGDYLFEELSQLDQDLFQSFDFHSAEFQELAKENGLEKAALSLKRLTEDYIQEQLSPITSNFELGTQISRLEKALIQKDADIHLIKVQYLEKNTLRKNAFKYSEAKFLKIKLNYNSFGIKALNTLASLNLITFLSTILIDIIFTQLEKDVLGDFKKINSFIRQQERKGEYFQLIKGNFDNEVDTKISDYEKDLNSVYDEISKIEDVSVADFERKLISFQLERQYKRLIKFIDELDLKTKDDGENIDHDYQSTVLKFKSNDQYARLMKKWAVFNLGNDYGEPKGTDIYGPASNSKWYKAAEYHDRYHNHWDEQYNPQTGLYDKYVDGLKNYPYAFIQQIIHEGLKFGISWQALHKSLYGTQVMLYSLVRKLKEELFDHPDDEDKAGRNLIERKIEEEFSIFRFSPNHFFNRDQALFYFSVVGGNTEGIEKNNITQLYLKVEDLNVDHSNNLICLDSITFGIGYTQNGEKKFRKATEWLNYT